MKTLKKESMLDEVLNTPAVTPVSSCEGPWFDLELRASSGSGVEFDYFFPFMTRRRFLFCF